MGTKFRTMLAPINRSTGDGRRFATGAITLVDMPMPLEWVRSREGGHGGAVAVGAIQEAAVLSVADALAGDWISPESAEGMDPDSEGVFGRGVLFDDVDRETMPRLAEDVATALHLAGAGTIGPSVDLDSFEGSPVALGTDDPVSPEDMEAHYAETGEEPKLELLITAGRVRAATLVSIPAFSETSSPFELMTESGDVDSATLVASVSGAELPGADAFSLPVLAGPTPITWDWRTGTVFGHIATWATCHVGYEDVCVTPPREDGEAAYTWFNRHPVETTDGTVWVGRITVGGRHAGLSLDASDAMRAYDGKGVAAYVRAYTDDHGIVVSGVIGPDAAQFRSVLDRRKVSGDWRETASGLSLVEVLALSPGPRAHSEPGFPVGTFSRGGRQVALTASFSPDPSDRGISPYAAGVVDVEAIAAAVVRRQEERARVDALRTELSTVVDTDRTDRITAARDALSVALGDV